MQEIGEIVRLAKSGRVIVRLDKELSEGQILCDSKSTRVARIAELIGPVSAPYASAIALTNNIKRHEGKRVFAAEAGSGRPRGGARRR